MPSRSPSSSVKRAELRPKLRAPRRAKLLELLDHLQRRTDPAARLEADPLGLVRRYLRPEDRVAAFIAAWLAFGRVSRSARPLSKSSPALTSAVVLELDRVLDALTERAVLSSFKHRWITGDDLLLGLSGVQALLRRPGLARACILGGLSRGVGMASALGTGVQLLQDAASRSPLGLSPGLGGGLVGSQLPVQPPWTRGPASAGTCSFDGW